MIGTWLPETCWATSRREIKNKKLTSSWFFLSTPNNEKPTTKLRHSHHLPISLHTFVPQPSQSRSRLYNHYLHIFPSLSEFFLLVPGWRLSYSHTGTGTGTCLLPMWQQAPSQISYFYDSQNPGKFGTLIRILRDAETEPPKIHKTMTVPEKSGRMGFLRKQE